MKSDEARVLVTLAPEVHRAYRAWADSGAAPVKASQAKAVEAFLGVHPQKFKPAEPGRYFLPQRNGQKVNVILPVGLYHRATKMAERDGVSIRLLVFNALMRYYDGQLAT